MAGAGPNSGSGMRASQEARWRKNVKETAARRRRIEKLAEEQRGKEELQRKEALERRKFERDLSDRFLRKPAAKPPEPIKPILRKGAGAQRYGAGTNSRKPLSPRSNVRQMQARLREHVRQQRERIKQQQRPGQHPNQEHAVLEESGVGWQTARKLAAQGLDSLLHEVIPEGSPPQMAPASHATACKGMDDLLRELGPARPESVATGTACMQPHEHGFEGQQPQRCLSPEWPPPTAPPVQQMETPIQPVVALPADPPSSSTHSKTMAPAHGPPPLEPSVPADGALRRGVTAISRHRPRPQRPDTPEQGSDDGSPCEPPTVCNPDALPAWARLAGSLTYSEQETTSTFPSQPRWAQLVDSQEVDTAGDTGVETFSFRPAVARDCVNYADENQCMATQQAEEGSNRLGKPVRPCGPPGHDEAHQEHLPAKQPADTGLDRSRGSLVAVGDSAQSFDFGVASSSSLAVSVAEAGTAVALGDGKVEAVNPALDVKDEGPPASGEHRNSFLSGHAPVERRPCSHLEFAHNGDTTTVSDHARGALHVRTPAVPSKSISGDQPAVHACPGGAGTKSSIPAQREPAPVLAIGRDALSAASSHQATTASAKPTDPSRKPDCDAHAPSLCWMPATQAPPPVLDIVPSDLYGVAPSPKPQPQQHPQPTVTANAAAAPDIARGGSYFGAQANADDAESKVRDVHAEARKAPDAPDLGVDGLRQCKGSYAAAMEATRKRADKEAHERARLAAELSKRRAQVSAREAKENKAKTKAEMRSAPRRPGSCVPKKAAPPMVQHSLAQQHAPVVAANIYAAPAPVPYPAGQPVAKPARKGVVNQALDASFEVSDCGDSDDGQELPDDWEAQIAAPRPSVPKHMQRAPGPRPASSNFARSPLAAALMQLVGLPGMHAPNAMPMAPPSAGPTPGMLGPAMADAALERLTAEEDALLKSLSRLDPKMLRKSLKSAGMDLWSHEGYLQLSNSAEQGKLLKSLARLDMQLQALRGTPANDGVASVPTAPVRGACHGPPVKQHGARQPPSAASAGPAQRKPAEQKRGRQAGTKIMVDKGYQAKSTAKRGTSATKGGAPLPSAPGRPRQVHGHPQQVSRVPSAAPPAMPWGQQQPVHGHHGHPAAGAAVQGARWNMPAPAAHYPPGYPGYQMPGVQGPGWAWPGYYCPPPPTGGHGLAPGQPPGSAFGGPPPGMPMMYQMPPFQGQRFEPASGQQAAHRPLPAEARVGPKPGGGQHAPAAKSAAPGPHGVINCNDALLGVLFS